MPQPEVAVMSFIRSTRLLLKERIITFLQIIIRNKACKYANEDDAVCFVGVYVSTVICYEAPPYRDNKTRCNLTVFMRRGEVAFAD